MAKIIHKKSAVVGKIPATADLDYGELALNYADGKLFYKASNNSIQSFGGTALSTVVRQQFTATAGQTNFTLTYTPGQLDVYLNGVKLVIGTDYTASSGTGFTLAAAAAAGDIVDVVAGIIFASSDWQYITNKPTTLNGFGITDGQPLSTNLTSISALTGTSGFLKTNGAGTYSVDANTYITGNQNIVFSGDATGNGTTSVSLTLANSGVTAGTYTKVMVDAKGRVTNGYNLTSADLPTYTGTITSSQVTTALGFTPYNATNPSGYISGNQTITFSGDATGSGATSVSLTLANSGVVAGTYGSSTAVPVVVVDAKGRVTSISTQSISGSLTFTGDVTGTGTTGSSTALTLANSGVTSGTYTKITVDAKGRATSGTTLSASDIPSLDASKITSGVIDSARLPSYVDDVLEYANLASFPATGETAKIYVALDSNKTYRWSGSAYIEISASPGTTDSLVEGSTNLYFTNARARSAISVTQNLTYNSTTGVITGPNLSSYLTGNQTITFSGDATGSGATSVALTLANSGVTAGTYTKVTVDAKGRVTTGTTLASADLPTYTGSITSSQVTTGLGFTPYNSTNPSGYQTAGNVNAYFGSATTAGTLDWNDVSNTKPGAYGTLLLGSATNGPGGGNYYHPFNLEYNSKDGTGNVTQMAVAYGTPGNELYMRGRYGGSWTGWTRYLNSSNYSAYALPITGGVLSGSVQTVTAASSWGVYSKTSGYNNESGIWFSANVGELLLRKADGSLSTRIAADGSFAFINNNNILHAGNYSSYALPLSGGSVSGAINLTSRNNGVLVNSSGTGSADAAIAIQQVTGEGWTGIFVDYEPYAGWGLWHDNPNNYFSFTAETSTGGIRSFTVPSRSSGNRIAYEKVRIDQNNGDVLVGGNLTVAGNQVLHASNYNSYSPTLTGTGASGTWGISISGSAAQLGGKPAQDAVGANTIPTRDGNGYTYFNYINSNTGNSENPTVSQIIVTNGSDGFYRKASTAHFISQLGLMYYAGVNSGNWQNFTDSVGELRVDQVNDINNGSHSNQPPNVYTYGGVLSWKLTNHSFQLYASHTGDLTFKTQWNNDNYSGWRRILHESNYTSFAPSLTGSGASGTWGINITGNAATASNTSAFGGYGSHRFAGPDSSIREFYWTNLSAAGTQAKTYEIARIGIDYNDWNMVSPVEIELWETYWSTGLKKKYVVSYGYTQNSNIHLTELSGTGANNFQCRIGTPVQISGDSYYLPVFVDVQYYTYCSVILRTAASYQTTNSSPSTGTTYINLSPSNSNISDFSADSTVTISNTSNIRAGSNTILHAGNYTSYAVPQTDVSTSGGADKVLKTQSNGYLYLNNWIHVNNSGLFSGTNSSHWYPNQGTYGSWQMSGSRNGYNGIEFNVSNGNVVLMINNDSNTSGFHNNSYGWQMRWNNGVGYIHKNAYGGGTAAVILDSVNYTNYITPASDSGPAFSAF